MRLRKLLIPLATSVFLGEAAIMFTLHAFAIRNPVLEGFLDATLLVVIVLPVIYLFAFRTLMTAKEQLEEGIAERTQEIRRANDALEDGNARLRQHRQLMVQLSDMSNFLQACDGMEEAIAVAGVQLPRLFGDMAGGLFLMNSSRNLLERVAAWGDGEEMADHHAAEDCWALRRSKAHVVRAEEQPVLCDHMRVMSAAWHVCLPLLANGEVIGALSLHSSQRSRPELGEDDRASDEWVEFYSLVAKTLAFAVANLRLQDKLRFQALRDPLTGLFNRRFLLDTFEHELERAMEYGKPLSLAMFDIDHFKAFNDTFGHMAGDAVLTQLGTLVRDWAEKGDIAVRFGGEEFTLLMPDTSVEQAQVRLETLRRSIEGYAFERHRQHLGQVTISIGYATYPSHGKSREVLIQSADHALYASKHDGRNRTTAAVALS